MMTQLTRRQLIAFVIVTTLALSYTAIAYVRLPALFGIGQFHVTVEFADATGLYPKANVTYQGVEVGTVTELRLEERGISVDLAIEDGSEIPSDVVAEVHTTSAIGEQYVNLVPRGRSTGHLEDGDVIPRQRTRLPVATTELLDSVNALLHSVPPQALATTVDELHRAFAGEADDLRRMLDAAVALQETADANIEPTLELVDDLVPVLRTQRRLEAEIGSYTGDLAAFSDELVASDQDLAAALRNGPGFTTQVDGLVADLQPTLPSLLTDLAATGQVVETYLPGIEHFLTVLPATLENGLAVRPESRADDAIVEGNLSFKVGFNNPPVCLEGFEYADQQRDPSDVSQAPIPENSYCKVAPDDPRIVRGARNQPCPNDPTRRGATAAQCGLDFTDDSFLVDGRDRVATYDPETGTLLAPNGQFFLLEGLGHDQPRTWQELMKLPLRAR